MIPEKAWTHISANFIMKLPLAQGYNLILVVVDIFTKMAHFVPTTERTSRKRLKQYADRERGEVEEYRVGNLVLLSTKDLKYQMVGRCTEKFTECFVGPYKVKAIISSNAIELELPSMIKIHPVVNVSRVWRYKSQVEEQKKEAPQPVVIEGKEE